MAGRALPGAKIALAIVTRTVQSRSTDIEETLTSDEALRRLRGRRSRAGVDAEAAAVLLEDWLADHGRESA